MLVQDSTAQSVFPLTQLLDTRRIGITPTDGSVLAGIMQYASGFDVNQGTDGTPGYVLGLPSACATPMLQPLNDGSGNNFAAQDDFDIAMEESVKLLAASMNSYIDYARNTVAPEVTQLAEAVISALNDHSRTALGKMDILVKDIPALLTNGGLLMQLEQYNSKPNMAPTMRFAFSPRAASDLAEIMKQGNGMDKEIDAWLATKDTNFLPTVWDKFFAGGSTGNDFLKEIAAEEYDTAMAVYFLAGNLLGEPSDPQPMPLVTYDNLMADFRDQAAKYLFNKLTLVDLTVKAKTVVIGGSASVVTVNGRMYEEFINAGGTPEILFGNLVQGNKLQTLDALLANAESLTRAWETHAAYLQTLERNERVNNTRRYFKDVFATMAVGLNDSKMSEKSRFNDLVEDMKEADFTNLYTAALYLVCTVRYPHTNAYSILSGIDRAMADNPSLHVREAATLSNLEYLVDWICKENFTVKPF